MRKSSSHITPRGLRTPSIAKTLKHYNRSNKNAANDAKPVQPTEEIVDRLNDIGKTYPFCVYYRQQKNDPL